MTEKRLRKYTCLPSRSVLAGGNTHRKILTHCFYWDLLLINMFPFSAIFWNVSFYTFMTFVWLSLKLCIFTSRIKHAKALCIYVLVCVEGERDILTLCIHLLGIGQYTVFLPHLFQNQTIILVIKQHKTTSLQGIYQVSISGRWDNWVEITLNDPKYMYWIYLSECHLKVDFNVIIISYIVENICLKFSWQWSDDLQGMLFICWYVDMLICWYVDMLICWYVDMLIYWYGISCYTLTHVNTWSIKHQEVTFS